MLVRENKITNKKIYINYIMASVYDYTLNQGTRIGNDMCDQSQQTIQNSLSSNYILNNYRNACPMNNAIEFATSNLDINFKGSQQVGIGGCNIDENSQLLMTNLSKPRCKLSLVQRQFATVPYLGRGKSDPLLESQIQQGELANNRKSITQSTELSFIKYHNTPMIPSLKSTINNPANLVEGMADSGWIRGGVPSRELARDKEYVENNN